MKASIQTILTVGLILLTTSCNTNNKEKEQVKLDNIPIISQKDVGLSAVHDSTSAKNIVQTAIGSNDHSTLVTAVKAAELVDVLSGPGPFTVFAPNNAAFNKLPAGTVDGLLKPEKKEELQDVLQYHVSAGVYKTDALTDGQILGQVNGGNLKISKKDGKFVVNGVAHILASIETSNGIIHVIDEVLFPKECCANHKSQWCNICD